MPAVPMEMEPTGGAVGGGGTPELLPILPVRATIPVPLTAIPPAPPDPGLNPLLHEAATTEFTGVAGEPEDPPFPPPALITSVPELSVITVSVAPIPFPAPLGDKLPTGGPPVPGVPKVTV